MIRLQKNPPCPYRGGIENYRHGNNKQGRIRYKCKYCKKDYEDLSLMTLESFARGVLGFGCIEMMNYLDNGNPDFQMSSISGKFPAKRPVYKNEKKYNQIRFMRNAKLNLHRYERLEDFIKDAEKAGAPEEFIIRSAAEFMEKNGK